MNIKLNLKIGVGHMWLKNEVIVPTRHAPSARWGLHVLITTGNNNKLTFQRLENADKLTGSNE